MKLKLLQAIAALLLGSIGVIASANTLTVGGKNFVEQQLLTSLTGQYLEGLGYQVKQRAGMGSSVLRSALENGQIDLYWEYTGTALVNYNKVKERLSPEDTYTRVKTLDAAKGLVWLTPSKANNTYALAMRSADAQERGITTLSQLAALLKASGGKSLSIAMNAEFYSRADGFKPLSEAYGLLIERDRIRRMDSGLTYVALKDKHVDVALVMATDGRIPAFNFTVLQDDLNFFPDYAIIPVVREATLAKNPQLAEQMNRLSALLDDQVIAGLNAQVDIEGVAIETVASDFLKRNRLI